MTTPDLRSKHAPWALPLPTEWDEAITAYLDHRAAGRASVESLKAWRSDLQHLARRAPGHPWHLTADDLERYAVAHDWARQTARRRRQSVLDFYRWAQRRGFVTVNPAEEGLPKVKSKQGVARPIPDADLYAALAAAAPRERLMLRLAAELGMRRGEIAQVHSRDLYQDLTGGWVITAHGKGDKDRDLPVPSSLAAALRELPRGYAFPGGRSGHLSPEWVGKRLARLLPGIWTLHTLRHRFATLLYEVGGHDLLMVQQALGHANANTTRRYVRYEETRTRAAVELMSQRPRLSA